MQRSLLTITIALFGLLTAAALWQTGILGIIATGIGLWFALANPFK